MVIPRVTPPPRAPRALIVLIDEEAGEFRRVPDPRASIADRKFLRMLGRGLVNLCAVVAKTYARPAGR